MCLQESERWTGQGWQGGLAGIDARGLKAWREDDGTFLLRKGMQAQQNVLNDGRLSFPIGRMVAMAQVNHFYQIFDWVYVTKCEQRP